MPEPAGRHRDGLPRDKYGKARLRRRRARQRGSGRPSDACFGSQGKHTRAFVWTSCLLGASRSCYNMSPINKRNKRALFRNFESKKCFFSLPCCVSLLSHRFLTGNYNDHYARKRSCKKKKDLIKKRSILV